MSALFETIARHGHTLRQFSRLRDRICYIYGRVLRRFSWPLPWRTSAIQVFLRGQPDPFHVRLGSTDWLVLEEIFLKDEYTFVRNTINDARWIVDLGANAGFSLRYWQTLFPKARIVAMEPDPDNCLICTRNISSGGLENQVSLLQRGVGSHRRQAHLVENGGEWAYRTDGNGAHEGKSVEIVQLLEVLEQNAKGQRIDLLKCDIEGAEKELFEDCSLWIDRIEAIAIELHPPYLVSQLMEDLTKAGASFVISQQISRKECPVLLLRRPSPRG